MATIDWHRTEEVLPPNSECQLFVMDIYGQFFVADYNGDCFVCQHDYFDSDDVTHWAYAEPPE